MSISSRITEIEGHLEDDYTALEQLGVSVEDRNIENIKDMANQIYAKFPKTEFEEGSDITLENTLKGKLDFEDGIVGIGDIYQYNTTGKNLLNYLETNTSTHGFTSVINEDGSITTSGKPSYNYAEILYKDITSLLEVGETYTISQKNGANQYFYMQINATNTQTGTQNYYFLSSYSSRTFTCESNTTYILRLQASTLAVWGDNNRTITNYYQLEKGSSATLFEKYTGGQASPNPSYPQSINSVTGNQNVVVSGKNYFKYDTNELYTTGLNGAYILQSGIDNNYIDVTQKNNGYYVNSYTNTGYRWYSVKVDLPKNKQLKFVCGDTNISDVSNIRIYGFNSLSSYQAGTEIAQLGNETSFNTGNYNYYLLGFYPYQQGRYIKDIMIIDNDITDLTYEPYITPKSYQLSLGDKKLYDECTIVGSPDNWKYVEWHEKVILKDLTWFKRSGEVRFGTNDVQSIIEIIDNNYKTQKGLQCNILSEGSAGDTFSGIQSISSSSNGQMYVCIDSLSASSVNDLMTLLNNTNAYAVIPLAQAKETPITDETLISQLNALYNAHSLNGTTILEVDGDLPMIIKVRALKGE